MSTDKSNTDSEEIAESIVEKAQEVGVTRRELIAAAAGSAAVGALAMGGSNRAAAQAEINGTLLIDQLGTSDNPVEQLYVNNQTNFNESEVFDDVTTGTLTDKSSGTSYDVDSLAGGGVFEDTNGDGIYEQTTGDGIETPSVSTEKARIDDTAQQFIPASVFASSGTGQTGSFYQGGIQEAHDATMDSQEPKPVKTVLIDGRFNDEVSINDQSAFRLMGWTWGSNIESNNQVLTVETTDVVVDTLWLNRGGTTGIVAATESSLGATEEFHAYDFEVEGGATGLYINGTDRSKLVNVMCQNNDQYGFRLVDSDFSNVQGLKSENTVEIDGGSHSSLVNITVEKSNGNGSARGLVVQDGSTDNFISGTVTQANGAGVVLGGSRNVFVGQSYDNLTSGSEDYSINFTNNAVECVALGYFGGQPTSPTQPSNWGTRCVLNGNSINSGDPNSTGDWNGHALKAFQNGVVVWDTSTSPETPYRATPSGSWVGI